MYAYIIISIAILLSGLAIIRFNLIDSIKDILYFYFNKTCPIDNEKQYSEANKNKPKILQSEPISIKNNENDKLLTTYPNELIKKEDIRDGEQRVVMINVDEDKGYFLKKNLNEDEIKFLLNKKYIISSHVSLSGGRQEVYLLKHSLRESNTHFFLVKAIEEYILQFTDKVKLYETYKPDIIFEVRNKKIAIEVETGVLIKDKKRLREKVSNLNEKYNKWFFVVVNAPYAYRYEEFGKVFTRKTVRKKIKSYFLESKKSLELKVKKTAKQRKKAEKGLF